MGGLGVDNTFVLWGVCVFMIKHCFVAEIPNHKHQIPNKSREKALRIPAIHISREHTTIFSDFCKDKKTSTGFGC